ncbi:plasmid mobilization protein [Clostridium tyrobutyricum]|jgi:hypothetical protein|uniref:plasmid mobilization protein n=1 Tax=Clostridium tyrobutyricum TaxID=1519 RepID=UPI00243133E2|nr:plasmid mobilization relaxosome protein MobC [Clostridium tyrobutyricum]
MGRIKDKQIKFWATEKEFNLIKKKVEESKLKQNDFLLKCALEKKIFVIDDLQKIFVELKRQGVNLNQLARAVNQGELNLNTEKLEKELEETWRLLRQLIQKIL